MLCSATCTRYQASLASPPFPHSVASQTKNVGSQLRKALGLLFGRDVNPLFSALETKSPPNCPVTAAGLISEPRILSALRCLSTAAATVACAPKPINVSLRENLAATGCCTVQRTASSNIGVRIASERTVLLLKTSQFVLELLLQTFLDRPLKLEVGCRRRGVDVAAQ